jgi:hypothetical protein
MRHSARNLALTALVVATVSLIGCRKLIDKIRDHLDGEHQHTTNCQVEKIVSADASGTQTLNVYYNNAGNPRLATNVSSQHTQDTAKWVFIYDGQNRLTDLIEKDQENRYTMWHRYAYDGQTAIRDTIYSGMGDERTDLDSLNGRPSGIANGLLGVIVNEIIYDEQGRIVGTNGKYIIEPSEGPLDNNLVRTIVYDEDGNRVINPLNPKPYDDKVSIFRTHKLWMFLHGDYSKNNTRPADTYNEAGLPTSFSGTPGDGAQYTSFLSMSLFNATIAYDCGK